VADVWLKLFNSSSTAQLILFLLAHLIICNLDNASISW